MSQTTQPSVGRIIPVFEGNPFGGAITVEWEVNWASTAGAKSVSCTLKGGDREYQGVTEAAGERGQTRIELPEGGYPWTPQRPKIYRLLVEMKQGEQVLASDEINWGMRHAQVEEGKLQVNYYPVTWRGGVARLDGGQSLADLNRLLFELKQHNANAVRFIGGVPDESLLQLCDRAGLMVWVDQWTDACAHHPSIVAVSSGQHPLVATLGGEIPEREQVPHDWRRSFPAGFSLRLDPASPPDWEELRSAWAAASVTVDALDRNYECGESAVVPLTLWNDSDDQQTLQASAHVGGENGYGTAGGTVPVLCPVGEHSSMEQSVTLKAPKSAGTWSFVAQMEQGARSWFAFRTMEAAKPAFRGLSVALWEAEEELRDLLKLSNAARADLTEEADMLMAGAVTWREMGSDAGLRDHIASVIQSGRPVLLLDVDGSGQFDLTPEIRLSFEPGAAESAIVPADDAAGAALWGRMPIEYADWFNGLDGKAAPSTSMQIQAQNLTPLIRTAAGQLAVAQVDSNGGRVIISHLLSGGRLVRGYGGRDRSAAHFDPVALHLVLNLMRRCYSGR